MERSGVEGATTALGRGLCPGSAWACPVISATRLSHGPVVSPTWRLQAGATQLPVRQLGRRSWHPDSSTGAAVTLGICLAIRNHLGQRRRTSRCKLLSVSPAADSVMVASSPTSETAKEEGSGSHSSEGKGVSTDPEDDELKTAQEAVEACLRKDLNISPNQLQKLRKFWKTDGGLIPKPESCKKVLEFFRVEVGLSEQETRKAVTAHPLLLAARDVNLLREKLQFLEKEAGLSSTDAAHAIALCPNLMVMKIARTLRPALMFWKNVVGMTPEELPNLLCREGGQAWMKPSSLHPTWLFAKEVMGVNMEVLLAMKTAPFFRMSLEQTIAPRHFFLQRQLAQGLEIDEDAFDLDKVFNSGIEAFCWGVCKCKPREFKRWLKYDWVESEESKLLADLRKRAARPKGIQPNRDASYKRDVPLRVSARSARTYRGPLPDETDGEVSQALDNFLADDNAANDQEPVAERPRLGRGFSPYHIDDDPKPQVKEEDAASIRREKLNKFYGGYDDFDD